jgi:hypothetical protein
MALSAPVNIPGASGDGTGSAVTGPSFTPTANAMLLVPVGRRVGTAVPNAPTISSAPALTWRQVFTGFRDSATGSRLRLSLWAARVGASPVAMTITSTAEAGPKTGFLVDEILGSVEPPALTNTGTAENGDGDPAPSMAEAPEAGSWAYTCGVWGALSTIGAPADFTLVGQLLAQTDCLVASAYRATNDQDAAWVTAHQRSLAGIVEIPALAVVTRPRSPFLIG